MLRIFAVGLLIDITLNYGTHFHIELLAFSFNIITVHI